MRKALLRALVCLSLSSLGCSGVDETTESTTDGGADGTTTGDGAGLDVRSDTNAPIDASDTAVVADTTDAFDSGDTGDAGVPAPFATAPTGATGDRYAYSVAIDARDGSI